MRRLKKQGKVMQEALERGIDSVGGLARAVYQASPTNKNARTQAAKLRYHVQKRTGIC